MVSGCNALQICSELLWSSPVNLCYVGLATPANFQWRKVEEKGLQVSPRCCSLGMYNRFFVAWQCLCHSKMHGRKRYWGKKKISQLGLGLPTAPKTWCDCLISVLGSSALNLWELVFSLSPFQKPAGQCQERNKCIWGFLCPGGKLSPLQIRDRKCRRETLSIQLGQSPNLHPGALRPGKEIKKKCCPSRESSWDRQNLARFGFSGSKPTVPHPNHPSSSPSSSWENTAESGGN